MSAPLVLHLLYRLDVGGMETLLIDCINRMPAERYRHAVVCLSDYTAFAGNITRADVAVYALGKRPGLSPATQLAFWRLLRTLRPAILHTYNLAAIEYHCAAALAGVPGRVHAEHGRDAADPHGENRRHNLLRRLLTPLIHQYIPVSQDLRRWLGQVIGVPSRKNRLVPNGVDTRRFHPDGAARRFFPADCFVIGTVGRLHAVKNHGGLIDAFIALRALLPARAPLLRLVIVGDGGQMAALRAQVACAGLTEVVCLAGAHTDIDAILRGFSLFVLSSIAEGTPVSILEAMASGLAVVSSDVGGIAEVVCPGLSGALAPAGDAAALARALAPYCAEPALALAHGRAARALAEQCFSIDATVAAYLDLYDSLPPSQPRKVSPTCVE